MEKPKLRALEVFPHEVEGQTLICVRDPQGISESVASFPPALAPFLFDVLDGRHTLADIRREYEVRSGGVTVEEAEIAALVEQLDGALFLESPRFFARRDELLTEYRATPARPACSAGNGYPAERDELVRFLDDLYDGGAPGDGASDRAVAVPHLDLRFGGRAAARGLAGLSERFAGDTVVVLGVGHRMGRLPYTLTTKDFETPLGTVPADRDLADRIAVKAGGWVFEEELVHRDEHSVEFAALLLKHAMPDREFRILPVLCGSFHEFMVEDRAPSDDPFVGVFLETLAEEAADALIYVSVDLAHMGPAYGDPAPLTDADLEGIADEDREMLARMAERDADGFLAHLARSRDRRRVCGSSALYTTLSLLPAGPPGELVTYEQPVFPEAGSTVTICSMRWA